MKTYEKPRLAVISLAGNERLCGDCSSDFIAWENSDLVNDIIGDWGTPSFNSTESCEGDWGIYEGIELYCKFNAVNDGKMRAFNS